MERIVAIASFVPRQFKRKAASRYETGLRALTASSTVVSCPYQKVAAEAYNSSPTTPTTSPQAGMGSTVLVFQPYSPSDFDCLHPPIPHIVQTTRWQHSR